jgi:hypothetical protein
MSFLRSRKGDMGMYMQNELQLFHLITNHMAANFSKHSFDSLTRALTMCDKNALRNILLN